MTCPKSNGGPSAIINHPLYGLAALLEFVELRGLKAPAMGQDPVPHELFISRAGEDKAIALIIDHVLRDAGFSTFLQDRDFGHTSFMTRMAEGFAKVGSGARLLAVLSHDYLRKEHCLKEVHFPLVDDPSNKRQRLIVLRIDECAPTGF